MPLRVLLVQSDMRTAQPLARFFKHRGDEVWQAWELGQGLALLEQVKPDLLLVDLHFENGDWAGFIRQARSEHPNSKIIMTNRYPDLQREMAAREHGVKVFLRQPFSARWIEQALDRLEQETRPLRKRPPEAKPQGVRVPVRIKITLPYLVLSLLFALASAYLISRVVLENVQDRFLNQLIDAGKQGSDWMVREENRLLESLRLVSNTQGVAQALGAGDAEALRKVVLPVAVNSAEEEITLLDLQGVSVMSLTHAQNAAATDYTSTRGSLTYQTLECVKRVLAGENDKSGDKFAGLGTGSEGEMFYVSGPVFDAQGKLAGVVLVGKSLRSLARQMSEDTLGRVTFYDLKGQPLATTLSTNGDSQSVPTGLVLQAVKEQDKSQTRDLTVSTVGYMEILSPWNARGSTNLGLMGVSLARAFLVHTSQVTQLEIFGLVAAAVLLVTVIGLYLANLITRPLLRLVTASSQVAQGNLEVKVDANGDDEVAVLAQSFNHMVAGLQEGFIYRDLLGRTVSPEVREQLRQTFTSGNLRLEGQEAVATVLMTDIRGFTTLSEKADPATVFQWLNEYFGQLVPIVSNHGGVVNKFDGDAMLAFFGTLPRLLSPKQSAVAACEAAVEVLAAIEKLNEQRKLRGEPQLITGIGIHTGVLIAGGLGSSDRIHYTIIGDTVNTTQRIESLTRDVFDGSGILVSQPTFAALAETQEQFIFQPLGFYQVKGKKEPLQVHRLLPVKEAVAWEGTL
jgi:class 3 adenylate cyclase/ActR/RegA family two-component response regulator